MLQVSRTLFICKEKLVIGHLDYASYCELNPSCIVRLRKKRRSIKPFVGFGLCGMQLCSMQTTLSSQCKVFQSKSK